ncbi:MAG: energy transducer TonB, partial [Taibaiella sp.]|nr:energy transducer TonB [Taibaiella sp.]
VICTAQTTQVKYYDNKHREVPERKARYVKTIAENTDGSTTTTETDLRTGDVHSSTYKGSEPYGIWKNSMGDMDYNFTLLYTENQCGNNLLPKLNNYFEDIDSLGYTGPRISGDESFNHFIAMNLIYPAPAKENGLQGRVQAQFTIGKDGSVDNIRIVKGVDVVLDKEFARVLRKLKFSIPPKINGQAVELCVTAPCRFRLE